MRKRNINRKVGGRGEDQEHGEQEVMKHEQKGGRREKNLRAETREILRKGRQNTDRIQT